MPPGACARGALGARHRHATARRRAYLDAGGHGDRGTSDTRHQAHLLTAAVASSPTRHNRAPPRPPASLARLAVGHEPLTRREHGHAHAAEHPGQPVGLRVDAQPGLGHALAARRWSASRSAEYLSWISSVLPGRARVDRGLEARDVALALAGSSARDSFSFEPGIFTVSCIAVLALRIRVSMSAMGSVIVMARPPFTSSPWSRRGSPRRAPCSRRQMRHRPNLRNTALGRPQRRHRVYARTLNFGLRCCFSISAFFAMVLTISCSEWEAEGDEERPAFVVGAGGGHDGDVHASRRVDAVVVDLGEDELLGHPEGVVAVAVERRGESPRKSRILGMATLISRSRNSQARSPRSVTLAPMGCPRGA